MRASTEISLGSKAPPSEDFVAMLSVNWGRTFLTMRVVCTGCVWTGCVGTGWGWTGCVRGGCVAAGVVGVLCVLAGSVCVGAPYCDDVAISSRATPPT